MTIYSMLWASGGLPRLLIYEGRNLHTGQRNPALERCQPERLIYVFTSRQVYCTYVVVQGREESIAAAAQFPMVTSSISDCDFKLTSFRQRYRCR